MTNKSLTAEPAKNKGSVFFSKSRVIVLILFISVFVYCLLISTSSSYMLRSNHGLYHSSYIYQLYNGLIPPTNPQAVEMPANVYWLWHFFISILMHLIQLSPLHTVALLNSLCFAASISLLYKLAREVFSSSVISALIISTVSFFYMAIPHVFYGILANGDYNSLYQSITGVEPMIRSLYFYVKFFNQSSYPAVIGLFCIAFYFDNRYTDIKKLWVHICEFVVLLLMGAFNPIGLFVFNLWVLNHAISLLDFSKIWASMGKLIKRYLPLILANLIMLPYIKYLSQNVGGELFIGFDLKRSLTLNGNIFIILLFIILTVIFILRRQRLKGTRFVCFYRFVLLGIICINLLNLPARNEYKIVQLTFIPLLFLLFITMRELIGNRAKINIIVKILGIAMCIFIVSFGARKKLLWGSGKEPLKFSGTRILLNTEATQHDLQKMRHYVNVNKLPELQDVCDWIRLNTPKRAYIMKRPAFLNFLIVPPIAQRRVFVALPSIQTESIEKHRLMLGINQFFLKRINATGNFDAKSNSKEYNILSDLLEDSTQLYAMIEKSNTGRKSSETVVYENKFYEVHKFKVRKAGE